MRIALRSPRYGYLTAELGGEPEPKRGLVTANRPQAGAWELWTVEPNEHGISLKSCNGFYLCAESGGGAAVYANRALAQSWERFTVIRNGSASALQEGATIGLQTSDGQHYLSGGAQGDHVVDAIVFDEGYGAWIVEVIEADQPPAQLSPLHADGWDIYTADGKRYVHNQATNYLLFQRFMEGQDIDKLLYDGFDGYNVTFLMKTVSEQAGLRALTPENYPQLYRSADDFLAYINARGKRIEGTFICDNDQLGYDVPRQNTHVNMLRDVFSGHPGNLVQLVNEWQKNGVDVMRFSKPAGVFASRGSSLAGGSCPLPAWDYSTAHLARSGGGAYLDAQPYYMIAGYPTYAGTQGPVITNETRGASETENSDRRTNDPNYFRRIAGAMREWNGGTFHGDELIHSRPMPERIRQCADGFLEGIGA